MRHRSHSLLALAVLLGGSAFAYAQIGMQRDDTRVLPYNGELFEGGGPATGSYDFRFGLFTSNPTANDADCLLDLSCARWDEESLAVDVSAGRFSVMLGAGTPIGDTVLAENALWLAIAVRENGSALPFAVLEGAQEILPAPWAARAAAAKDFKVSGELDVANHLNVTGGGATIVGGASVAGGLDVTSGGASIAGDLDVSNDVFWSTGSYLRDDQGGSIEVGGSGVPYIDFHNDTVTDYDARLQLVNNDLLRVDGADLGATLRPDYDSGWQSIPAATSVYTWNHNLGVIPTRSVWLASNAARTWVMMNPDNSRADAYTSPEQTWYSANQVTWSKYLGDYVVWCDAGNNPCPSGMAASTSGYMRLLLWK